MSFNFPNSPSLNQTFPFPAVAGSPTWKWNGVSWVSIGGMSGGGVGQPTRFLYNATAGQSSYSGADSAGNVLTYIPGAVEVVVNGIWIPYTDYTATTGSTIVLANPSAAGEVVYVYAPTSFAVSDAVSMNGPQALSTTQQAQARSNIYAAPFDAMAYFGMQCNGAFEVDQLVNGNIGLTSGTQLRFQDGAAAYYAGTAAITACPTAQILVGNPAGFTSNVGIYNSGGAITPATTDVAMLLFCIEGYRFARAQFGTALAQPVSVGFWVYTDIPGSLSVSLQNAAQNRTYPTLVTVPSSGWNWVTATFPGDTAGTWLKTNGAGAYLWVVAYAGTSQQGTLNTWNADAKFGAAGLTNFLASAGNPHVAITGLTVLPGLVLPPAARTPFLIRPFDEELRLCQRYFQKSYNYAVRPGLAGANEGGGFSYYGPVGSSALVGGYGARFGVSMRTTPVMTAFSPTTGAAGKLRDDTNNADVNITLDYIGDQGFRWYASIPTAATGFNIRFHWQADARL